MNSTSSVFFWSHMFRQQSTTQAVISFEFGRIRFLRSGERDVSRTRRNSDAQRSWSSSHRKQQHWTHTVLEVRSGASAGRGIAVRKVVGKMSTLPHRRCRFKSSHKTAKSKSQKLPVSRTQQTLEPNTLMEVPFQRY